MRKKINTTLISVVLRRLRLKKIGRKWLALKAGRKATVIFIVSPTSIISSAKSSKHMEEIFKIIGIDFYSHYEVHSKS
jgi:hypothetical protein